MLPRIFHKIGSNIVHDAEPARHITRVVCFAFVKGTGGINDKYILTNDMSVNYDGVINEQIRFRV